MINDVKTKKWIWVTFQRAGLHYYPEAGSNPNLKDVSYLSFKHRHLFKFRVQIQVTHNNRDLEFHQVLGFCEGLLDKRVIDIDNKSMEMLADDLYGSLSRAYPERAMKIEVSEDGECGGLIEYFPQII